MKLRIATRGSALALAQADWTARRLGELGHETELVKITTSGDRFLVETPAEAAAKLAGGKGIFVKEIEDALLEGRADLAVHSAKDLPGELAPGLEVAAYPERVDPWDVLAAKAPLAELPARARIGTSSLRRQIQLKLLRSDLEVAGLRGNVDTRLRRMRDGDFDGVVIAAAGLRRLGRTEAAERLDIVSAPGQGAIALEARSDRPGILEALGPLEDARCRAEVEAERRLGSMIGGGCLTPLGARAELDGGWMRLTVFWSDAEGRSPVRLAARTKVDPPKLEASIRDLAERIRQAS